MKFIRLFAARKYWDGLKWTSTDLTIPMTFGVYFG